MSFSIHRHFRNLTHSPKIDIVLDVSQKSFINQNLVHNNIRITKHRLWDSQVYHIDAHLGMISKVNQINQRLIICIQKYNKKVQESPYLKYSRDEKERRKRRK